MLLTPFSRCACCALPRQAPPLRFPWSKAALVGALWLLFLAFQLSKERFARCSWQFAAVFGAQAAAALALSAGFGWAAVRAGRRAAGGTAPLDRQQLLDGAVPSSSCGGAATGGPAAGGPAAPALPAWTGRQLAIAVAVALLGGAAAGKPGSVRAGLAAVVHASCPEPAPAFSASTVFPARRAPAAGMLGIGGGMIVGPLLLELGVHPAAASATSALMVLFSASSAVVSFAAAGRLPGACAALLAPACLAAAAAGSLVIGGAVRRSGRASALVLILAGVIGLGAAATVAFAGRHAVGALARGGALWGGTGFCA